MTILPQPKPTRADRHKGRIDTSSFAYPRPVRYEDAGYRKYVRESGPCMLHNFEGPCAIYGERTPLEAAHLQHGAGKGTKGSDATCARLCPRHHDMYDAETLPWQIVAFLWMQAFYLREAWWKSRGVA